MYIKISNALSRGVLDEMKAHEKGFSRKALDDSNTPEEYYLSGNSLASQYYAKILSLCSKAPTTILDVGVGNGQSSVFLAAQGVTTFAVEPDSNLCNLIHEASEKYSLPITVCEGVGEDIQYIDRNGYFDEVVFNASLHHCDSPIVALTQAYAALRPGGGCG